MGALAIGTTMNMRCLFAILISIAASASASSSEIRGGLRNSLLVGPYRGRATSRSSPQNPSCVWFTLQDNLPAETVQIITYGAPEMSAYLALSLSGDQKTFPQRGQTVRAHYTLFLDDCTLIESSRDNGGEPFEFVTGIGQVIEGWEVAIPQLSLGQRAAVTLSPDMAYGEDGAGDGVIPPNAALIFDIEIVSIV